jgi:hypothetical protein
MKAEKKRIKRRGRLNKTKKMPKNPKTQKQLTLDSIPNASQKEPAKPNPQSLEKRIVITEIGVSTKEDELALKVSFKLFPSKTAFSKVQSDLLFDNQKINSVSIRIPQGALAADEFELTPVLDMKGIPAGAHVIKVEMYELWSSGEKFSQVGKEVTVDYVPQTRESKYVKIPSVKSIAGTDLMVVSESEKNIYRDIEETMKKENSSKRDSW